MHIDPLALSLSKGLRKLPVLVSFKLVTAGIFGLLWGSFLNFLAYRLTHQNLPLWGTRSQCPHCLTVIQAKDLIPVASWLTLQGKCRSCSLPISFLYPCIELITGLYFIAVVSNFHWLYWPALILVGSALIITIRTDIESLVICRICSLWLAPVVIVLAYAGLLPIAGTISLLGAITGYIILATISWLYKHTRGVQGMGEGDPELMSLIGAAVGPMGAVYVIAIAATAGAIIGLLLLTCKKQSWETKLPFGAALAATALIYIAISNHLALP